MAYKSRGTIQCVLCGKLPAIGRKLCRPCYNRTRSAGELEKFPALGPSDVFELRIQKTDNCWLWTGTKNDYGYGVFLLPGEKPVRAHRYAFEYFTGKNIPADKIILHICDNPPCVNPAHLRLGTKDENNKDTGAKRRHNYGLQHWNGKLSDDEVREIRKSSEKQSDLAKRFGVSQSHISHLRSGKHRNRVV